MAWSTHDTFVMYELDGTMVWENTDGFYGNGLGACAGYDADGDGDYEIFTSSGKGLSILDGSTGVSLFEDDSVTGGHSWDYPVIADVDRDGSAEIVVPGVDYYGGKEGGVRVIGHPNNSWAEAGPNWPVHDYAVSNIDADLSVPAAPDAPWTTWGLYRARPQREGMQALADLTVRVHDHCVTSCECGDIKLSWHAQDLRLKLHVKWKRATSVPASSVPTDRAVTWTDSPVSRVFATAAAISRPDSQTKVTRLAAFFVNSASMPTMSMLMGRDDAFTTLRPRAPVLISAAMAWTAKYMLRKGLVVRQP